LFDRPIDTQTDSIAIFAVSTQTDRLLCAVLPLPLCLSCALLCQSVSQSVSSL
jgi:hypothetical protein